MLAVGAFYRSTDPDLWWHLKTGELIVNGRRFFSSDPFSWTASDRTWYLHEWLSEVLLYWVQSNLGFVVDVAIIAGVLVATMAIVYRLALRVYPREIIVLGLVLLSSIVILDFTAVRPQVFSWLFFAVFFRQLYLSYRGEPVRLWPLPLLMVLWANMHLGYLFGLMMVYVWLAALVLRDGPAGWRSLRGPVLLAFACTLAPVISPIGPGALLTPIAYAGSNRVAVNVIQEWRSANFHTVTAVPLMLALLVLLTAGLPLGRRHLFTLMLTIAVVALSLVAARNFPLLAVLLPVVFAESAAQRWPAPARPLRIGLNRVNWAFAGVLTVFAVVAIAWAGQTGSEPKTPSSMPSQGVEYVRAHSLGARMFNSYNWGGYLVHQLYPDVKVSIDGRSDLYGDDLLQRYLDIGNLKPGWREELAEMDPDFIFLPRESPLAGELMHEPGWKLAFEGRVEAIFVPAGGPGISGR